MPSATEATKKHSTAGPPTLTGSDVKGQTLAVTFTKVEESPEGWTAPLKAEFKPAVKSVQKDRGEITVIGLNKTNVKVLAGMFGDDYEKWSNKKVTFLKMPTNNPSTNQQTWGLRVIPK